MSYKQAKEFSTVFGQAVHSELSKELVILRSRLVNEEILETLWASRVRDDLEIIDGIADIAYVVYGTLVALDKKDYSFFDEIKEEISLEVSKYAQNDRKYVEVNGIINDYFCQDAEDNFISKYSVVSESLNYVLHEFSDYIYDVLEKECNSSIKLFVIIDILSKIAQVFNVSLEEIVDIVHESNMSKLDSNGNPVYDKGGKVLKGENYFAPTEKLKELLDSRNN